MLAFYRERVNRNASSKLGVAAIWARVLPDLLITACAERLAIVRVRRGLRVMPATPSTLPPEEPMSILHQDVRFALRGMIHRPGFTAVILATLALGIGANAAIFSVVDAVLLRPLAFAHVERIVDFTHEGISVSEPEFVDYQRGVTALAKLAAYSRVEATLMAGDQPMRASGTRVSADFFEILGVKPIMGRTFARDEFSHLAKGSMILISSAMWRQQYASDPRIVGKTIQINGNPATIIGVMPSGAVLPDGGDTYWTRWRMNPDSLWTRNNHYLRLVGELKPGATLAQARTQVRTLNKQWMRDFPETYFPANPITGKVTPIRDYLLGPTRPYMLALLGAVSFILLIACVNVANLLLVRGESRKKEFAIRTALGASGNRVVRQMLTESMLYAFFGAALGMAVAWIGVRGLVLYAPRDLPRIDDIGVDYRVIAFTALMTLVTGVLFGLAPALRGRSGDSADSLRDGGKTSATGGSRVARRVLVVTEVALAVIMLTGAGLLLRSLVKLQAMELGFKTDHILTMQLTIPPRRYNDTTADEFFRQIVERVRHLPGVQSVALDGALPITGDDSGWSIMLDGRVVKTISEAPYAKPEQVTAGYFETFGIPVVSGRAFTEADRRGAPPVAVINGAMAKKLWPGVNPIGHTLKMFNPQSPWVTIVGVVGDVHARGFQEEVPPTMYFPYSQSGSSAYFQPNSMTLVVKTATNPAALAPAVRSVVRGIDAQVPISRVATMEEVVARSIASRRFTTILLGGFATIALALAGIGIYGVIAYGVSQRTFEIGVRVALGASAASVVQLVMAEGVRMTLAGLAIGLIGALAVDRLLRGLLVGVTTTDPTTFAVVVGVLVGVAACACALPARRATAVSPTEALRNG
jgi:predicted permease